MGDVQNLDQESQLIDRLPEALGDRGGSSRPQWDFSTFRASQLAFCPRQVLLSTLGLRKETNSQGTFTTRQILRRQIEDILQDQMPHLEISPSGSFSRGGVTVVGRYTAYDPRKDVLYHLKPRNGWYRISLWPLVWFRGRH